MRHHAQIPTPRLVSEDGLRIYFATRDDQGRSRIGLVEVDPDEPATVQTLHDSPILDLGRPGTFDDSGVMPSSLVDAGGQLHLYYVGWTRGVSVPYRNAIGLAISTDGGSTFTRAFEGPVVDRDRNEPFSTLTCFVLRESGISRMWYTSTTDWVDVRGRFEPVYVIKYAESEDGVAWRRENVTCITPRSPLEANGRPWVLRDGDTYRMWYSHRGIVGYRDDPNESYRIGYAESTDGVGWQRKDEVVGIEPSESGWDSEMIAYPSVYEHRGTKHLLYNGNGFGASGMGHAVEAGQGSILRHTRTR
jgi:hypothetical protein